MEGWDWEHDASDNEKTAQIAMRIAYVYDVIHPYVPGGVQKRIWELSRRLVARGHEVTLFGMKHWEGQDIVHKEGVRLWGICPPKDLFVNDRRSISAALYVGCRALPVLPRERFDVIDCQNFPYFPCFSAKIASVLRRSKLIITWHEVWAQYWYHYLGRKGMFGAATERLTGRLAKVNLVGTRHNMNMLLSMGVKKDRVTLLSVGGVSLADIEKIAPSNKTTDIIFAGRLIKAKGMDSLLRALAHLKTCQVRAHLSIVGDGPERAALEDMTHKLDIQDEVQFHGHIGDDAEVISMVKSAKVFVYPASPEGGWSISIIEANACGIPAVSFRSGNLGDNEVVVDGYNGLLAEQQVPNDLGTKIRLLLEQVPLRTKLGQNALEFAQRQDWGYLTGVMEDCYSRALVNAS
jgi:glycosyltransferase involved in cell wall biosynthesis